MMREYKSWCMVRRIVTPPAFPAFIRPGTAHRPKHIASEDPRTDAGKALLGAEHDQAAPAETATTITLKGIVTERTVTERALREVAQEPVLQRLYTIVFADRARVAAPAWAAYASRRVHGRRLMRRSSLVG